MRSSHCDSATCVEVWRKSSRSSGNGACVEVALAGDVLVRDSKDPDGPRLKFSAAAFAAFLAGVKAGEMDRR